MKVGNFGDFEMTNPKGEPRKEGARNGVSSGTPEKGNEDSPRSGAPVVTLQDGCRHSERDAEGTCLDCGGW